MDKDKQLVALKRGFDELAYLFVKGGLKMSFYGEIKLYDYGGLILR